MQLRPPTEFFWSNDSSFVPQVNESTLRQATNPEEPVVTPPEMNEEYTSDSEAFNSQCSKASLATRQTDIGVKNSPGTSKYVKEDKGTANQTPSIRTKTTKSSQDVSVGSQNDLNALGALGMPRWSSKGKGKARMPRDSLSFYITPSQVKKKMEELIASGPTSITGVEGKFEPHSTEPIQEDDIEEDIGDIDFSIGKQKDLVEATQSSTSRMTLGPLGMPSCSSRGKAKGPMPADSLSFYITPFQIKEKMEETQDGGQIPTSVEINTKQMFTQSILVDDFDEDSKDISSSLTNQMKEDIKLFADQPPSNTTTTKDVSIGSQDDLDSLGALGMPRWSSRTSGKTTIPIDSLSFYVTPLQIKQKLAILGVEEKPSVCVELDSRPLSTQSIIEDDFDQDDTDMDWPFVGYVEKKEEIQSSMPSHSKFISFKETKPKEENLRQSLFTLSDHTLAPTLRDHKPPIESPSTYITEDERKHKDLGMKNKLGAQARSVALPPTSSSPSMAIKSKPFESKSRLGNKSSRGHELPTDSLSFYITPLQIKQQMETLEKWSSNLDHAQQGVDEQGKLFMDCNFSFAKEDADKMQKPPLPPLEISSPQISSWSPSVQATTSGFPSTSNRQAMPTDSLSLYITPGLVKQQLAKLQESEEDNEVLNENLDFQDQFSMPRSLDLTTPSRDNDDNVDIISQPEENTMPFLRLAPLRVIPEDEAVSTDDSSSPSSSSVLEYESQPNSHDPTSLATRLRKFNLRKSKSAPSTPSHAPSQSFALRRTTSWSELSTPIKETMLNDSVDKFDNDLNIQWITVHRT
ncbi:unnamed protein product [Calypogeia fissa]